AVEQPLAYEQEVVILLLGTRREEQLATQPIHPAGAGHAFRPGDRQTEPLCEVGVPAGPVQYPLQQRLPGWLVPPQALRQRAGLRRREVGQLDALANVEGGRARV